MTILDKYNEFSDAQAVTVTALSTNVIDLYPLGNAVGTNLARDIGTGEDIHLVVSIPTLVTGAGTLTVTLESDDNTAMSSSTIHYNSGVIALASLTAGAKVVDVKLPAGAYERYVAVRYTVTAGPFTGGAIDAYLCKDSQAFTAYKAGYTVA
jgi:hypothetical protein